MSVGNNQTARKDVDIIYYIGLIALLLITLFFFANCGITCFANCKKPVKEEKKETDKYKDKGKDKPLEKQKSKRKKNSEPYRVDKVQNLTLKK